MNGVTLTVVLGDLDLMRAPVDGDLAGAAMWTANSQQHVAHITIRIELLPCKYSEMCIGVNGEELS